MSISAVSMLTFSLAACVAGLVGMRSARLAQDRLRGAAWEEAVRFEREVAHEAGVYKEVREHNWLFDGPTNPPGARSRHQYATHWPVCAVDLGLLVVWHLPRLAGRMLWHRLRHPSSKGLGRDVTDQEVYELVTSTPTCLMARLSEDGSTLSLSIPVELNFAEQYGGAPGALAAEALELCFATETGAILSATSRGAAVQGQGRVSRNGVLVSALTAILTSWAHPTSHRMAERSAREIARKGIEVLEPSARFVTSLHAGLIHGGASPVALRRHPLHIDIQLDVGMKNVEAWPVPPHDLDPRKMRYPYFRFIMSGNGLIRRLVRKHGLDVAPEPLFHNLVMHAADHQGLYGALHVLPPWSWDGSGSLGSYFRAVMFTEMWVMPRHNPLETERVCELEGAFYRELYEGLAEVDEWWARQMVSSCSF